MMSKVVLIVTVAAVAIIGCSAATDVEEAKNAKDSYLAALKNSHKINALPYKGKEGQGFCRYRKWKRFVGKRVDIWRDISEKS